MTDQFQKAAFFGIERRNHATVVTAGRQAFFGPQVQAGGLGGAMAAQTVLLKDVIGAGGKVIRGSERGRETKQNQHRAIHEPARRNRHRAVLL